MEALQLVESGRKAAEVSRDLDIPIQTLSKWLSKYRENGETAFVGSGKISPAKKVKLIYKKDLKNLKKKIEY